MNKKMIALCRKYKIALGEHLNEGAAASLRKASRLGQEAVGLGLETLDLARIHEGAMLTIFSPLTSMSHRDSLLKRGQVFFIEALAPIERTHRAALNAKLDRDCVIKQLLDRTRELAISRQDVKDGIVRRKAAEQAFQNAEEHYKNLLKESQSIQKSLRTLVHRVLSNQESERGQISGRLNDEISQELLGINVWLLNLNRTGNTSREKLLKDIRATQSLVDKSTLMIRRMARESRTT